MPIRFLPKSIHLNGNLFWVKIWSGDKNSFKKSSGKFWAGQTCDQATVLETAGQVANSSTVQTLPSSAKIFGSWQQGREAFNCPTLGLAYVTTETCRSGFLGPNTLGYLAKAGLNWGACQNPNARPAASLQVGLGTTLPATQCLGATF